MYAQYGDERVSKTLWSCVRETETGCWEWRAGAKATKANPAHKPFVTALHPAGQEGAQKWRKVSVYVCPLEYECVLPEHWEPTGKSYREPTHWADTEVPDWLLEAQQRDLEEMLREKDTDDDT